MILCHDVAAAAAAAVVVVVAAAAVVVGVFVVVLFQPKIIVPTPQKKLSPNCLELFFAHF